MTFRELATFFDQVEGVSGRLEMTDILADLYGKCSTDEAAMVSYLISGRVAPMFIPAEFNVAEKSLLRLLEGIASASGKKLDVRKRFSESGDLGLIAEELLNRILGGESTRSHSLEDTYEMLWEIATVSGTGSVDVRGAKIADLLSRMSPVEARYAMRILLQKMRLGASSKTILDVLSVVRHGDKQDREAIERAYGVCSDLGYVSAVYMKSGVKGLEGISIVPGVPVSSMLVEREKDAEAIMKRMPKAIVQPKYDGLRCQIHIGVDQVEDLSDRVWWKYWGKLSEGEVLSLLGDEGRGRVRLFSRNLEDMTDMFPDVVEEAGEFKVKSAVLDAEVVGYSVGTDEFIPFQETMVRKRKYGVRGKAEEVPVKVFVFDVLYLDGDDLMDELNGKRIAKLGGIVRGKGIFEVASSPVVETAKALENLFENNIQRGLEGVVIKDPGSMYRPGKRGFDWIKLKRASAGHLADTVDVVIMGYYFGKGRQADFGIGAILGGVYDAAGNRFVSLAKIGTGMTDEQWKMIKRDLDKHESVKMPKEYVVDKGVHPDQWVHPSIVATVEADEITKSPIHTAGRDENGVGYALRFPRLKEWNRDKSADDATSVKEVLEMYRKQG